MTVKNTIKRLLAIAQVAVLALTLCVNASAADSSYNAGTRHLQCTALSGAAEQYYADYTYRQLAEQPAAQLLTTLRMLMTGTHSYQSSYADCRDMASRTDSTGSEGSISLLYTSVTVTRADFGGNAGTWNREHVWPKSLGGFDNSGAGSDLHHIRPSDATVNAKRDNLKYGNVTNGATATGSTLVEGASGGTYSSPYFEPLDNVKGDVARICLYVYVRYGGELSKCSSITTVFESVDVLLEWCELDPVDEWEMSRNDVVEEIQGNRNVFIDYPEYAWLLFEREVPNEMVTPSGMAKGSAPDGDEDCAHAFGEWEENSNGERIRTCTLCGKVERGEEGEDQPSYRSVIIVAVIVGAAGVAAGVGGVAVKRTRSRRK
ncbi:MAG: hypothetical protein E7644_01025 [Ruminococcaceae bacterium]|nr:hypothetical protein [Oscillospiraceae bacterium]